MPSSRAAWRYDLTIPGQRTPRDHYVGGLIAPCEQVAEIGDNTDQIALKLNFAGHPLPGGHRRPAQAERTARTRPCSTGPTAQHGPMGHPVLRTTRQPRSRPRSREHVGADHGSEGSLGASSSSASSQR